MKCVKQRHQCNCFGYFTLVGSEDDILWDICPVCFWENDIAGDDINKYSGANHMTLAQGRENFLKCAACDPAMVSHIRSPKCKEFPTHNGKNEK